MRTFSRPCAPSRGPGRRSSTAALAALLIGVIALGASSVSSSASAATEAPPPTCGYVDMPKASCVLSGLRPGASYRFRVIAVSVAGESAPAESAPLTTPAIRIPGTVQAMLCAGSELEKEPVRLVRPTRVILDCDAYSPQYGAPLIRYVDDITWSAWTKRGATGVGMLRWPTAIACESGEAAANCGQTVTDYPVTIELRNPQPMSESRKRYSFTEVGLYPTGPGPVSCERTCWVAPPRLAYQ